ncbi:alpha/beta hydrolase [Kitasatospora sp. NBC_01302]|uniref:alpha/beta hydrolase n=1 Tax=Kitasatospora sp. NBC_01302 TaxID=2903575 RepID=UPI002E125BBB|nr:alpha/beta hydrolase [Kitasatospora sp. NBC_01302]
MSADPPMVIPRQSAAGGLVFEGLTYAVEPGFRPLLLDLHLPPAPADGAAVPLVVWVHGGGFHSGDRRHPPETVPPGALWAALTGAGIAVATVDYRLSGEARFPAQLADLTAALAFLRRNAATLGLDGGRIALWGESAGAALAALAAFADARGAGERSAEGADGARGVAALVLWYPITDLSVRSPLDPDSSEGRLLGGAPRELARLAAQASPVAQVPADPPPALLIHGLADVTVPSAHSERLHEELLKAGGRAELRLVPGAAHIFAGCPDVPALVTASVRFLARELGC